MVCGEGGGGDPGCKGEEEEEERGGYHTGRRHGCGFAAVAMPVGAQARLSLLGEAEAG